MTTSNNTRSKNFFVKAAFTVWFACIATIGFASNYYWVGGTGNWSDYGTHWATSSGGVIFHTTVPGPMDDVYFDGNSFTSTDTVTLDVVAAFCNNMDWTGVTSNPVFIGGSTIKIYGSLTLVSAMKLSVNLEFKSPNIGNTITMAGQSSSYGVTFDNLTGGWMLNDELHASGIILKAGTLITNNQNIHCQNFYAGTNSKATAILGTSTITCDTKWEAQDTSYVTLDATSSYILVIDSSLTPFQSFRGGSNHQYGDVAGRVIDGNHNSYNNAYLIYPYERIEGSYNTFNGDVIFSNHGGFNSSNSFVHNIYFSEMGAINSTSGGSTFDKAVFVDDAYFTGNHTFDTLIFNNPGKIITFENTTTVNNHLVIASGLPAFPTTVHSSVAGTQAILSFPSDTLCSDYLYLQDINATGGAVFYAGSNSVNLGNNSGWNWGSCTPDTSNVWPGDANYDLTANNLDLLYVGLGYGYTGTTRAGASNTWVAQPSVDWLQQFANGINLKNADCNGDGIIDNNDTTAIGLNYGLTHPFKPAAPLPNPNQVGIPFYLVPSIDTVGLNYNVNIDIYLGTSALQVNNAYGIAFTLSFTTGIVDTSQITFDYTNSMLGNAGVDMMTFNKSDINSGYIDFALTRTDHNNISGNGFLGRCGIVIVDNVAGKTLLQLDLTNITAFDKNEFPLTFAPVGDSIVIDTTLLLSVHQLDLGQFISVYPNPAKDILKINGGLLNIESIELTSIMGEKIYSKPVGAHSTEISTRNINNGLYVLQCVTDKGIVNRRVQVLKY